MARTTKNYINNKQFYEEMVKYKARGDGVIPNYIGECFMKICNGLAKKPNFANYTYRDEMISDAIENCVMAVNSFNPEKTNNPFAYFTTIAYYAFIRRIQSEKKQQYIKHKNIQSYFLTGEIESIEDNVLSNGVIEDFENKMKKKEKT